MRTPHRAAALGATAATLIAGIVTSSMATAAPTRDTTALRDAVTVEGILEHDLALQAIADANGGNRAAGTQGYADSVAYVADQLTGAGYEVTIQDFSYDRFVETSASLERISPDPRVYVPTEDFITMEYSGAGDVTAAVTPVDVSVPPPAAPGSTSGCEPEDFAAFPAGNIALVQRGTCTFRVKVDNAAAAGASGVIIFNEGQEGRTDTLSGTLDPPQAAVPTVGTSFAVGEELVNLSQAGPVTVRLAVEADIVTTTSQNVIADSPRGLNGRTVVVGAHLDSVPEGPGFNDNGSGTSAILEIALQMVELGIRPRNQVRFAFWGAEESGLIGSEYYVSQLGRQQIENILVNLNFDMVGSPNYARFVYDGDGSASTPGPEGSARVEEIFNEYFAALGLATQPTPFDGRSDYRPFIDVGIPAGGLFTGAEGVKTEEQAALFGGVAGAAFDPCYHQACDDATPEYDDRYVRHDSRCIPRRSGRQRQHPGIGRDVRRRRTRGADLRTVSRSGQQHEGAATRRA